MQPDLPVYGLNISFGWPLPDTLKEPYEELYYELLTLGPDIYIYPYNQTHVTVITLVNFKKYENPTTEKVREFEELVPKIISLISRELSDDLGHEFKPFKIDVGWPVLLKNTAILPILNPRENVFLLREKIAPLLKDLFPREIIEFRDPKFIHSTILRFMKPPLDVKGFMATFESVAVKHRIGEATINELLLTSETKPYMRGGEKLHHFRLGE